MADERFKAELAELDCIEAETKRFLKKMSSRRKEIKEWAKMTYAPYQSHKNGALKRSSLDLCQMLSSWRAGRKIT